MEISPMKLENIGTKIKWIADATWAISAAIETDKGPYANAACLMADILSDCAKEIQALLEEKEGLK